MLTATDEAGTLRALDRIIAGGIAYLFVTLPFAVTDLLPVLRVMNRLFLLGIGVLAAYVAIRRGDYKVTVNWVLIALAGLGVQTVVGMAIHPNYMDPPELLNLFAVVSLVLWAMETRVNFLPPFMIGVAAFFSVDVIIQRFVGVDLFGFTPFMDRYWGAFRYGAPTFGVFAMTMMFAPLYYVKRPWLRWSQFAVISVGLILSNDRAPILQVMLASLLFMPIGMTKKMVVTAAISLIVLYVYVAHPMWMPSRILLLFVTAEALFAIGPARMFANFGHELSYVGYIDKWTSIVQGWFTWDNGVAVLFGTGWGSTPFALEPLAGVGRPHSTYIDVLVSLGLVGFVAMVAAVVRLWWRNRGRFLLVSTSVLPVAFFSMFSANWLFLIMTSLILMCWAPAWPIGNRRWRPASAAY